MKNITHYFTDSAKSCESSPASSNEDAKEKEESENGSKKKRARVKIKISRTNSKGRVCDIVESKNDLIDKTPSPFAKVSKEDSVSETPKRLRSSGEADKKNSGKAQILKEVDLNHVKSSKRKSDGAQDEVVRVGLSEEKAVRKNGCVKSGLNGKKRNSEELSDDSSKSKESNAFHVLMSNKSAQCASPTKVSPKKVDSDGRKTEEERERLKQYKERLVTLAEKKGYSKRKLAELEEGERIERVIENRIKLFKSNGKKTESPGLSSPGNSKQVSNNLLSYFSKVSSEKDIAAESTFVVEADVHLPGTNPVLNQKQYVKVNKTSNVDLSQADKIEVLESPDKIDHRTHRTKPRWALRIKLQSYEDEDSLLGSEEKVFSPRSKAKTSTESTKITDTFNSTKNGTCSELFKLQKKDKSVMQDEDKERNFFKLRESKQTSTALETKTGDIAKDEAILIKDDSEDCEILSDSKKKPNEKLAPLFTKRRRPDPATLAARRSFLQSDIIDIESKSTNRKINTCGTPVLPFPTISHVTQLISTSDCCDMKIEIRNKYIPSLRIGDYKCLTNLGKSVGKSKAPSKPVKANLEETLTEIEGRCSDAREMWKVISSIAQKQLSEKPSKPLSKRRSGKKDATVDHKNKEDPNYNSVWTCKYKPTSTKEIVGNEEAAGKLRDWLNGWRSSLGKDDASSSDEFYSSDCSYNNINENNQVAVLLGPYGSGKSASVYAVAEELGYSVLEVNASSKRPGKKILKELEEATKSHRIKKEKSKALDHFSKEKVTKQMPQNSLILLEDVDLIFEEDEGFVSATYQLASNTKRPIAMTCRDVCPHLGKMAPQQNKIVFHRPVGNRVSALLELISLAETGYRLSDDSVRELLQTGDLRKALLQLQYLLLSGPARSSQQSRNLKISLWQDMRQCIYKPAVKTDRKTKAKKSAKNSKPTGTDTLQNVANNLDGMSLVSSLIDVRDPALDFSHMKLQPSLSLVEDTAMYSASDTISSEIAEWIGERILHKEPSDQEGNRYHSSIMLKKQINRGVDLALSHVTSLVLDRRSMSVDYLPSVRAICRAEDVRATTNSKRGNRFFHYLQNLKLPTTSVKPNILAAACKMMQEKTEDNNVTVNNSIP